MFNFLRRSARGGERTYGSIKYSAPGTPTENSARLLELVAQDFEPVRERTDEQCMAFGRFMSIVLLLERKLIRLLSGFDCEIEARMFGRKIDVYKDFLSSVDWSLVDLAEDDYRNIIAPLKEVKKIRDRMSHDLFIVTFSYSDLRQTVGYVNAKRPDLAASFTGCADEQLRCLGAVMAFGFVFSQQIAPLQQHVGA